METIRFVVDQGVATLTLDRPTQKNALNLTMGTQRAKEIMLSTRELDAEEAHRLGIAFEIHPAESLLARAQALAQSFVQAPPTAVSLTKRAVSASLGSDLQAMLELEAVGQALAFGTDYHRDAVARFGRKEPARFRWPESN